MILVAASRQGHNVAPPMTLKSIAMPHSLVLLIPIRKHHDQSFRDENCFIAHGSSIFKFDISKQTTLTAPPTLFIDVTSSSIDNLELPLH